VLWRFFNNRLAIGAKMRSLGVWMPRRKIAQLEILGGWKEIANYLGKGVRTVQRYECELGLPIRRPAGRSTGSVIATKAEIDGWISASPFRETFSLPPRAVESAETLKELKQQVTELHRLREESAQSRLEMCDARKALKESIELLKESLALVAGDPQLSSRRRTADILSFDPKTKIN
jgi:hypothetical protein